MENYNLLQATYEINIETKRIKKEILNAKNNEEISHMKSYQFMLYRLKEEAMFYIMYFFEHTEEIHNYNNISYWLIRLSGFEYHFPYVKIPKNKSNNIKIKIKTKDYNKVVPLGIGVAIQTINDFKSQASEDKEFIDFSNSFKYFLEKEVRPLVHH